MQPLFFNAGISFTVVHCILWQPFLGCEHIMAATKHCKDKGNIEIGSLGAGKSWHDTWC
jgi:hypothetical protein